MVLIPRNNRLHLHVFRLHVESNTSTATHCEQDDSVSRRARDLTIDLIIQQNDSLALRSYRFRLQKGRKLSKSQHQSSIIIHPTYRICSPIENSLIFDFPGHSIGARRCHISPSHVQATNKSDHYHVATKRTLGKPSLQPLSSAMQGVLFSIIPPLVRMTSPCLEGRALPT